MKEEPDIKEAIANLKRSVAKSASSFDASVLYNDEWASPSWEIERCVLQVLAIAEALGLVELRKMIVTEYAAIKQGKEGFMQSKIDPDGQPYSAVLSRVSQFSHAFAQFFQIEDSTVVAKDLLDILHDIHHVIADEHVFAHAPLKEEEVHTRIEGILRCVYPDLKHKPAVTKAIKNFEPDTGIPSLRTLIEYKFLSCAEDVGAIADQVLADTRGYTSGDWKRFLYVIYETRRFRPEKEWNNLLRQSGVPESTRIIVLSGEPTKRKAKKKALVRPRA